MNENHDEKGRFAAGDSVTVVGKSPFGNKPLIKSGKITGFTNSGPQRVAVVMGRSNGIMMKVNMPLDSLTLNGRGGQRATPVSGRLPKGATPVTFKGYND